MRKLLLIIIFAVTASGVCAQSFEEYKKRVQAEYDQYRADRQREFKAYRDRINAEFADYMRRAWPEYKSRPADPVPDSPEPPAPVVRDPDARPSNDPLPFDRVMPAPAPAPAEPPQPVVPLPRPSKPVRPSFAFTFYGERCGLPLDDSHRFTLAAIDENRVADGWRRLSSDDYLPVVAACLDCRTRLRLCDWGYVRFVERMTEAFLGAARQNEARLMQMYILTQSGYKVRIARADGRLVLLLPSQETIYCYPYLTIGSLRYYIVDSSVGGQTSLNVYTREFPNEQLFSLRMDTQPQLPVAPAAPRTLRSKHDASMTAEVSVNANLMAFYDDYPQSGHWDIYAGASLSERAKSQLYPVLRRAIAGRDKPTAANMLLHFVQTAFDYATDEQQFGAERALFADETLYYPCSDCEDRAILYSVLVRELLGLDVVLLHYPGHLASAVCFDTEVAGDHLQVDGRRYVVCDPTYINANIGEAMPQFKRTAARVVRTK